MKNVAPRVGILRSPQVAIKVPLAGESEENMASLEVLRIVRSTKDQGSTTASYSLTLLSAVLSIVAAGSAFGSFAVNLARFFGYGH